MLARYCIWTLLTLLAVPAAAQQQEPAVTTGYTIFLRGVPVGREDVTVQRDAGGITLSGKGRLSAPVNLVTRRVEVRYKPDWTPESLSIDATVDGGETTLKTSFADRTAQSQGVVNGQSVVFTDEVTREAFVLPPTFFGSFEAIARRLLSADGPSDHRAFSAASAPELPFRVDSITRERMQTGTATFDVRRYVMTFTAPGGAIVVNLYSDDRGTMLRLNVPAQALDVVRDDLASSTARTLVYSNPGDEAVVIPSAGFNLGATLTRPAQPAGSPTAVASRRQPVVILLGSSATGDRDGGASGVPILGQLAGALADAGFVAVRYDKRGFGQSGGRAESATLGDHAGDARAVVRWLAERPDVDRDRIALLGHGDGAWVALLAASRERRVAAVVSIAAPSTKGTELVQEQQQQTLAQLNPTQADRDAKEDLQQRINAAVLTGRGWDTIPTDIRRQADTPWFQSFLAFDPAKTIEDVRQPLLFVHGQLDRQIPVTHVDRLADLARTESDSKSVAVVTVRGVNHLLVPADTGEIAEYALLQDRTVSQDVTDAIRDWLTRTFASIR